MTLSNDEIVQLIEDYEKESKALTKHILELCWFMRGGVTLEQAWQLGHSERLIMNEIVKEHMEITKESSLPFF